MGEEGGEPELLVSLLEDDGTRIGSPVALPGGQSIVVDLKDEANRAQRLGAWEIDTGRLREIGLRGSSPVWSPSGHLLWIRDGDVWVAAFDPEGLTLKSEAVRFDEPILTLNDNLQLAIAADGTLAYFPQRPEGYGRLVRVDRSGRSTPISGGREALASLADLRLSPDGQRLLLGGGDGIWMLGTLLRPVKHLSHLHRFDLLAL